MFLLSCSKDNDQNFLSSQQKWQLKSMSGSNPNMVTTGNDMEWQEYYLFDTDGTFKKYRNRDDVISEIIGVYIRLDSQEEKYLELSYQIDHEIIGSCENNHKERLRYTSENKLINTWNECDGPKLEYELVR